MTAKDVVESILLFYQPATNPNDADLKLTTQQLLDAAMDLNPDFKTLNNMAAELKAAGFSFVPHSENETFSFVWILNLKAKGTNA